MGFVDSKKHLLKCGLAVVLLAPICGAQEGKAPATPNPQKMDVLRQLSASFEEVSERSGRAVVQIFVRGYVTADDASDNGELLTAQNSSGSGIILSPDGYILTNAHVVKGAHSVKVHLNMRTEHEAELQGDTSMNRPIPASIVGIDRETDLAVIKIDRKNLPFLNFGNSDELKQGQIVLALGNPLGLDNSVSMGVVSAVSRQLKTDNPMVYIQTDAPINPGNSGGPLLDTSGNVVGLNTMILTQSGGSEGIGFAIPSNIARGVYAQLKSKGHVHRAQLGLVAETITPELADGLTLGTDHGVIVSDVEPEGAAANGGVQDDDIIVGLNGQQIVSLHGLESRIYSMTPGTKVTLQVKRGDSTLDLPVVTEEQSGEELDALADLVDPLKNVVSELGIVGLNISKEVLKLMPELRRPEGVVVAARKANAPFTGPPLEVGDVIYSVNRQSVNGVDDLRRLVTGKKSGDAAVLLVERSGHLLYIPLQMD
jgi:serine protease Do